MAAHSSSRAWGEAGWSPDFKDRIAWHEEPLIGHRPAVRVDGGPGTRVSLPVPGNVPKGLTEHERTLRASIIRDILYVLTEADLNTFHRAFPAADPMSPPWEELIQRLVALGHDRSKVRTLHAPEVLALLKSPVGDLLENPMLGIPCPPEPRIRAAMAAFPDAILKADWRYVRRGPQLPGPATNSGMFIDGKSKIPCDGEYYAPAFRLTHALVQAGQSQVDAVWAVHRLTEAGLLRQHTEAHIEGQSCLGTTPELWEWWRMSSLDAASASVQQAKAVYISYKCGDDTDAGREREAFIDRLDASLQTVGYDVRRDKRDIGYKDSILKFMDKLGRGHCIVVVLSDEYLRSEFCMYELVQIYLNHEFRERICPVLVSDFRGLKRREQNEYVQFWVNERDEAQQDIASIPGGIGQNAYGTGIGRIRDIAHYVADILSHVFDMNCLNQAQLEANDFQLLKQAIDERMEEPSAQAGRS